MATDIQLKRSYTSGSVPGAANVLVGEPVLNLADRLLYTKDSTGRQEGFEKLIGFDVSSETDLISAE